MTDKIVIYLNTNAKMSRGKAAAHAVHAALTAAGVHPGIPVVVLGGKPRDIEQMHTHIRDAGRTELEPGTLTAGTNWRPTPCTHENRTRANGVWYCDEPQNCGNVTAEVEDE